MAKSKKKKPKPKIMGPIIDAEFERKETTTNCQNNAEKAKGEKEMTNDEMMKEFKEMFNNMNERITKQEQRMNEMFNNMNNNVPQKTETPTGLVEEKTATEKKGIIDKAGDMIKEHPVMATIGGIALAGGAAYGAYKMFWDDDDDDDIIANELPELED